MELTVLEPEQGVTRVALSGRLDVEGVAGIDQAFSEAVGKAGRPAIVDMAEVQFMTSLGMGLMLRNARDLAANGAKLVLYRPTEMVADVVRIAGLNQLVPMENDLEAAMDRALGK